jgi:hypothetical protein
MTTRTVRRSAVSGRFVTKGYTRSHPSTTEKEHRPTGGKKPQGRKYPAVIRLGAACGPPLFAGECRDGASRVRNRRSSDVPRYSLATTVSYSP